jgi:hypothetical protein
MNRHSTAPAEALSVKRVRRPDSPMGWPVQLRVAHWQQVSFVPLVNHACANVSARNQSETINANFS